MGSCISSAGYASGEAARLKAVEAVATAKAIEMAIIAIDNANSLYKNYKKQRDIADRSLAISEELQAQQANVFWPRELQFLNEFANPEDVESVETMGRRYAGRLVAAISGGFAMQLHELKCSMSLHCTSANKKSLQDMLLARSFAIANAKVLARQIAFAEYHARNDINWDRRKQAIAIGRGLIGQASSLLSVAGDSAAKAGSAISGQLNSALEAAGFALNRDVLAGRETFQQFNTRTGNIPGEVGAAAYPDQTDAETARLSRSGQPSTYMGNSNVLNLSSANYGLDGVNSNSIQPQDQSIADYRLDDNLSGATGGAAPDNTFHTTHDIAWNPFVGGWVYADTITTTRSV